MACERLWKQHEFTVSRHDIIKNLLIAIAIDQPLAHDKPQIAGKLGIGIVDRLVLADHAAQFRRQGPRPMFQGGIGQHLIGIDGEGMDGGEQKDEEEEDPLQCQTSLPLTLTLSPQAGRGDGDAAALFLLPACGEKVPAGG